MKTEIGDQFFDSVTIDEEKEIREVHLMQVSKITGENTFEADDLGPVDEDGCISAPWDRSLFPTVYKTAKDIWLVHAESYGIEMWTRGATKQEAVDKWNRRA